MAREGVRNWRDVSHGTGRWRTWAEMGEAYPGLVGREDSRKAYAALLGRMRAKGSTAEGKAQLEEWWREVGRSGGGWQQPDAEAWQNMTAIQAARRTAECLGSWEYKVKWEGGETTWEPAWSLYSTGGPDG